MVREANGQSKLRFSQVFWTLVLAMTLSHNFLKCENMYKAFSEPLFSVRRHLFKITRSSNSLCRIHFRQFYLEIVYTLWISFRGGSGQQLFQLSQQFATVCQRFYFFFLQHQHSQLFIYFHKPVIFPDLVDFPCVHKFSTPNFHFPDPQQLSADSTFIFNCSKEQILVSAKSLIPNRYTNQPTSRIYFLCACRWHMPIAKLCFLICVMKLLLSFINVSLNFDKG